MSHGTSDIEYAKHQIDEARRRLDDIQSRVESRVIVCRLKDEEDGMATGVEFYPPPGGNNILDVDDLDEVLERPIEEYDITTEYRIDDQQITAHIQNVVIDCQLCIELAAKSMFKIVGKDHPFSHGISFNHGETQGFYSELPEDFDRDEDIVRVIFLTQFWSEYYELAKYGAPQLNVRPEMIFRKSDASRAIDDAEFSVELAEYLYSFAEDSE